MTKQKDTVPAAPDTPETPPTTDAGAGTSAADETTRLQAPPANAQATNEGETEEETEAARAMRYALLPGGEFFDVDTASEPELDEHLRILEKKERIRKLTQGDTVPLVAPVPVQAVEASIKAAPLAPNPTDIRAVKDGEVRYFSDITWKAMETKGEHDGWQETVAAPAELT